MNLPRAIERMNAAEKKAALLEKESPLSSSDDKDDSNDISNEIEEELIDVEYDEEYLEFLKSKESQLETMSLLLEDEKDEINDNELELGRRKNAVRDFSIESWNGSPGLDQWGYELNYNET